MITSSVQSQKQLNLLSYLLPDHTNLYKQIVTGDSNSSELDALNLTCIIQRDISSLSDFGEITKVGFDLHLLYWLAISYPCINNDHRRSQT